MGPVLLTSSSKSKRSARWSPPPGIDFLKHGQIPGAQVPGARSPWVSTTVILVCAARWIVGRALLSVSSSTACDGHHIAAHRQPLNTSPHIDGHDGLSENTCSIVVFFLSSAAAALRHGPAPANGAGTITARPGDAGGVVRRRETHPLRDFFKNVEKAGFQLSPDGKSISFMQSTAPDERFVQPRKGGPAVRVSSETERSVAGYF